MNKMILLVSVACVAYVGITIMPMVGELFTVTAHALSTAIPMVP